MNCPVHDNEMVVFLEHKGDPVAWHCPLCKKCYVKE